ncbi:hypothetical protein [Nocardia sp. BMG111209]|uniref:hypothetical protein n=1 Tax=Nocardia sp. BMG111209 TaxID=1160137 RepID=UPI0018CBE65B
MFRGRDIRLRREVAIKQIGRAFTDDEEARRRFAREARITSRLHHPGVLAVFDFDKDELYLVMERPNTHGCIAGRARDSRPPTRLGRNQSEYSTALLCFGTVRERTAVPCDRSALARSLALRITIRS